MLEPALFSVEKMHTMMCRRSYLRLYSCTVIATYGSNPCIRLLSLEYSTSITNQSKHSSEKNITRIFIRKTMQSRLNYGTTSVYCRIWVLFRLCGSSFTALPLPSAYGKNHAATCQCSSQCAFSVRSRFEIVAEWTTCSRIALAYPNLTPPAGLWGLHLPFSLLDQPAP